LKYLQEAESQALKISFSTRDRPFLLLLYS
jgi:hypothetical protein